MLNIIVWIRTGIPCINHAGIYVKMLLCIQNVFTINLQLINV